MLVTVERYREVTGDVASASAIVEDALAESQELLEEKLRRPLEKAERTERCRIFREARGPATYPAATPIDTVSDPAGAAIIGRAVLGGSTMTGPPYFLTDPDGFATITYVGGYDPAAAVGDLDRLPRTLERAICWAARALIDPSGFATGAPTGAQQVRVGDVAVTWGPDGAPGPGEIEFSRNVRKYRRRLDLVS